MPSVVYRSGAEVFRSLLPGVSDRKPCKTKIIAFISRSCKLLAECRLIAYPSQACSVFRSHTVEVATKGRSSFLGADAGGFCIKNVWGFWSVRRNAYWWLDKYFTNPMNLCTAGTSSSLNVWWMALRFIWFRTFSLFSFVYAVIIPHLQDFIDPTFLFLESKNKPEWIWRASVPIPVMKVATRQLCSYEGKLRVNSMF